MSIPITWQNVNAPSNNDSMRGMALAQQGITGGFDKFASLIADREQVNQSVADRGRQASQEEYLNLVQSYKTPEDLQAARMSGVLDQRLAALDPRNQAAVRGATESRITSLQQQATAGNAYADSAELLAQRPVEEQIKALRASGQYEKADELVPQLTRNRGQFLEANRTASRARSAEAQVDRLSAINDPLAVRAAEFKTRQTPEMERQALLQQELTGVGLVDQQRTAREQAEDRLITSVTTDTASAFRSGTRDNMIKLGGLAAIRGYTLDALGAPDMSKLTPENRQQLDADAKKAGLPTTDQVFSGNTKMANLFLSGLESDTRFTPQALARNRAAVIKAFDTSTENAAVGNDAYNSRMTAAIREVTDKEADSSNWYAPNSPNAMKNYEELTAITAKLFTGEGFNTENDKEDLANVNDFIFKMATQGIRTKDGKMVTPSKQDILGAINSTEGGFWRDDQRANRAKKYLQDRMETSGVIESIQSGEKSRAGNRQRAVAAIMSGQPQK